MKGLKFSGVTYYNYLISDSVPEKNFFKFLQKIQRHFYENIGIICEKVSKIDMLVVIQLYQIRILSYETSS